MRGYELPVSASTCEELGGHRAHLHHKKHTGPTKNQPAALVLSDLRSQGKPLHPKLHRRVTEETRHERKLPREPGTAGTLGAVARD